MELPTREEIREKCREIRSERGYKVNNSTSRILGLNAEPCRPKKVLLPRDPAETDDYLVSYMGIGIPNRGDLQCGS